MPNWVINALDIKGDAFEVKAFRDFARTGNDMPLDFNNFIQSPEGTDTYDWCVENWGTKWNAVDADIKYWNDAEICFVFQTAWNAPVPVIEAMSRKFPNIKFTLESEEESGEFFYEKVFVNGNEVEHKDLEQKEETE